MAHTGIDSDQGLAEDVLPVRAETPVPIPLDTIKPWHRPRKQYIREHQWIFHSRRLIKLLKGRPGLSDSATGPPEVGYLTLPGIDYLDVRLLADVCQENGCSLTSIGFIAGSEQNRETARAKLRERSLMDAGHITRRSHTFPTRFEELALPNGQAITDLERKGPFHIVNIDVSGSIAASKATYSVIDAIHSLVELQIATVPHRWLLFVTADIRQDSLDEKTLAKLGQTIIKNASQDHDFRDAILSLFNANVADIKDVLAEAVDTGAYNYLRVFALGFTKWLIHIVSHRDWSILTHDTYCYSTGPSGDPTMPCLAFEFVPPPKYLPDLFEVSRAKPFPSSGTNDDTAIRAVEKVASMDDLDDLMRRDRSTCHQMLSRTKDLLKEAGYSNAVLSSLDHQC